MTYDELLALALRSLAVFALLGVGALSLRSAVVSYRRRRVPPEVRAELQAMILRELGVGPEALEWLRSNENPNALASNRFCSTAEAVAFVERLYDLGAVSVLVSGVRRELSRAAEEGGPYADGLVVVLPEDSETRQRLFRVAQEEARRERSDPTTDWGQQQILLWWD